MDILHLSHLVVTSQDVKKITSFFKKISNLEPYFENEEFAEFILPSKTRIAFFKPTGTASQFFDTHSKRTQVSFGLTVKNIEAFYKKIQTLTQEFSCQVSGPPKEHPWGEKSFLLIDPDENRWEIAESPTPEGVLVNR